MILTSRVFDSQVLFFSYFFPSLHRLVPNSSNLIPVPFYVHLLQDNALLRIGDILRWEPISMRAGSSRTTLSFQRGFLPLLKVCLRSF